MSKANGTSHGPLLSIGEASRLIGCSVSTLRKYSNTEKIACYRVPGGARRFKREDLEQAFGLVEQSEKYHEGGLIIIYARVSSSGQKGDLTRQTERLKDYVKENYGKDPDKIFSEIGSGLSGNRKGFNSLVAGLLNGVYQNAIIVLSHHDRLMRHGDYLFMAIVKHANASLVFTEDQKIEGEEGEIARDIIELLTHYSAKIHTKRSADRTRKVFSPELQQRILELRKAGHGKSEISRIVNEEGFRCCDATGEMVAVGVGPITRFLKEKPQLEDRQNSSVAEYFRDFIIAGPPDLRLKKETLYEDYRQWCESKKIEPLNPHHVGRKLTKLGVETQVVNDPQTGTKLAWRGIMIRQKEKLSFTVKQRKTKPAEVLPDGETSFAKFYKEKLKGSGRKTFFRPMYLEYKAWCLSHGYKPDKMNHITVQLIELGGHYSTKKFVNGKGGMQYSF